MKNNKVLFIKNQAIAKVAMRVLAKVGLPAPAVDYCTHTRPLFVMDEKNIHVYAKGSLGLRFYRVARTGDILTDVLQNIARFEGLTLTIGESLRKDVPLFMTDVGSIHLDEVKVFKLREVRALHKK